MSSRKPMKYAHLADLHLGSWREPKMRDLSTKAFMMAVDQCIQEKVDFILFAGDLFNTSLPSLDTLKLVTKRLKEIKDLNIPIYVIAGSHDFSPSGKTMIDVLENAGLLKNVCKGSIDQETKELRLHFTIEEKTGVKLTGLLGRKGQLDQQYYETLDRTSLEQEQGYKIFMFHTTVSELLSRDMDKIESQPLSVFPKTFDYYAGGHIHHPAKVEQPGYKCVTYPGALFPNNFQEVEKYGNGGYYLITVEDGKQEVTWKPLEVVKHQQFLLQCNGKSPEVIHYEVSDHFEHVDVEGAIVTIRLQGSIKGGRVFDINFKEIFERLYQKGAYFVMKNTAKLQSEEFEEIKIAQANPELVEEEIIKEHLGQHTAFPAEKELEVTRSLLNFLDTTKKEGETQTDFQKRVEDDMEKVLGL